MPYGLDILKGLAQTCNQFDAFVKAELLQNVPDTTSFDDLSGRGTAVATLIAGLSAKTKPDRVESLAKLSAKEIARRNVLEQSLRADNPMAKAAQLRLLSNLILSYRLRSWERRLASVSFGICRCRSQSFTRAVMSPSTERKQLTPIDCFASPWERAVEEILFGNVVIRFRKGISTQQLAGVVVEDSDYALIESEMTKCSNHAHDQALLGGTVVPDPEELLADINALDEWRLRVLKRSEATQKQRKAGAAKAP